MKGKQLFLLLILAGLAGGGWYYLSKNSRATWSATGTGGGKVIEFPVNEVTHIKIKNASDELNLHQKDGVWVVPQRADYPANFEKVSGFLRKLYELKTAQEVKVGPSQLSRLELEEPGKGEKSGTLVEFFGKEDKSLGTLIVGKKQMRKMDGAADAGMGMGIDTDGFATGRYVKTANAPKVSLITDVLDDVDPKPERWVSKDFIKVDAPKSIAVAGPTDAQKWTVTRESATADWKLTDAKPDEKLDSNKTFALASILSSPSIDDVLAPDAKPAETGLDKPTTAKIETFEGFTYDLKIGKNNGKSTPVTVGVTASLPKERTPGKDEKAEDKTKLDEAFKKAQDGLQERLANEQKLAGRVFLVPQSAVEPLLKDRAGLLADKPAEPAPAPGAPPAPTPGPGAAAAPMPPPPAPVPAPPVSATPPPPPVPPAAPAPAPESPAKPAAEPPSKPAENTPAKPTAEPPAKPATEPAPEPPAKPTESAPAKPATEPAPKPTEEPAAKP